MCEKKKHFSVFFFSTEDLNILTTEQRSLQSFLNCESRRAAECFILAADESSHHQGHGPFKYKLCIAVMSLTTQKSRFITQLEKSVQSYFIMKKMDLL